MSLVLQYIKQHILQYCTLVFFCMSLAQYDMQHVLQYVTCSAVRYAACSAVCHLLRSTICSMFCSMSHVPQYAFSMFCTTVRNTFSTALQDVGINQTHGNKWSVLQRRKFNAKEAARQTLLDACSAAHVLYLHRSVLHSEK
jgi:hypothetical protein